MDVPDPVGKITVTVQPLRTTGLTCKTDFFRAYTDLVKLCVAFRDRHGKKAKVNLDIPELTVSIGL